MTASILEVATQAAVRAGEVQRRWFGSDAVVTEEKDLRDYVSRVDRDCESVILEVIRDAFPQHSVLAEEGGLSRAGDDYLWIVDPLDGTNNFLRGVPYFCVSIACRRRSETIAAVVLDALRDDLFTAEAGGGARRNGVALRLDPEVPLTGGFLATGFPFKAHPALEVYLKIFGDVFLEARGVRRCGAAALDLAYTAAGVYDGFFEFRLSPWDLAAGALLIQEAGGTATDLDGGDRFLETGNVIAGAPRLQPALRRLVEAHADEASIARLCDG